MYEKGEGVKQNYAEALHWYTKAAKQGDVIAKKGAKYQGSFGRGRMVCPSEQ
jgi:TPR repeat protein